MGLYSWLNKEFVEDVLRSSENDNTICVTNISTAAATNRGDNYTSNMIRVNVDFSCRRNSKTITQRRSLIIKAEITDDIVQRKLIEQAGVFELEIEMMTTFLREMNSIIRDTKFSSECYFTQKKNPSLLVLEDLAALGFRMTDRQARFDSQHSKLALRNLAKFHAASVAICEKTPDYKKSFRGLFHPDNPSALKQFFKSGMKKLANAMTSWPEIDKSYSNKLMKLSDVVCERVMDCRRCDVNEFNVINHGDYWINNMLFKYDDNGDVIDHIMVDFQLSFYGSPTMDLSLFLNTSLSETILENEREELIEEYLRVLTSTMHELRCKTNPPHMTELKSAMDKREVYGLLCACTMLPVILVDKDNAPTGEDMASEIDSTFNTKAYQNEIYRMELTKKLPRWNAIGLLDT